MTAWLPALLLLAATHGKAHKPATPAVTPLPVDQEGASRVAKGLGFSDPLVGRVEKYARDADRVSKGSTDAALCALVDQAGSLGADLHAALGATADATQVTALEEAAPGLQVAAGAKGGASYAGLARLAAARHASSATVLSGAAGFLDGKHPAFIVMKTEEQGCTDYSRAVDSVQKLANGWKGAPPCLKQVLKHPLSVALHDDELPNCWCADADHAAYDTKAYTHYLSELDDFSGHDQAKVIKAEVDESSANFTCNAP